ncbi:MAG: hypothetical protein AB1705_10340 [Verrucomicrobiota bacterium]
MSGNDTPAADLDARARSYLVWVVVFFLVPLVVFFSKKTGSSAEVIKHPTLVSLVESNLIVEGRIRYSGELREITGTYRPSSTPSTSPPVPFKITTRLSSALEENMLISGKFEVVDSSPFVNAFLSLLPLALLLAVLYVVFQLRSRRDSE